MPRTVSILNTMALTSRAISSVGMPRIATPPPWAIEPIADRSAAGLPDISIATSKPSTMSSSANADSRVRSRGSMASDAPILVASARR